MVARSMTDKILDHELAESSRFYIDRILGRDKAENQPSKFNIQLTAMSGSRKESGGGGVG